MSNVIKDKNVQYVQLPRCINISIPIIDTGHTTEQKRKKMLEEIDELLNEFCHGDVDKTAALSEMFDVLQVMAGYLLCEAKEMLSGEYAHDYVETLIRHANDRHYAKIKLYAAERGWKVIRE
jgi:hypothetical protein